MRGRTTLLIAAGFIGTIAGAGATGASAQGVYLEGTGFWYRHRQTLVPGATLQGL